MSDKRLDDATLLMNEALTTYRKLVSEGKWSVRSKKEHNAFLQKKKTTVEKKAKALKGEAASPSTKSKSGAYNSSTTKKTHDGQGHPIDCTPPKSGEPNKRTNPLTKKDEFFCTEKHCKRWGNHATEGHADWYKKLIAAKEKRKAGGTTTTTSDSPTPAASSNVTTTNPLQIPTSSGN